MAHDAEYADSEQHCTACERDLIIKGGITLLRDAQRGTKGFDELNEKICECDQADDAKFTGQLKKKIMRIHPGAVRFAGINGAESGGELAGPHTQNRMVKKHPPSRLPDFQAVGV